MVEDVNTWQDLVRSPLAETRELEYKEGVPWPQIRHKVARSVLAMANSPNGGRIVIGVHQEGQNFAPAGIDPAALASYKLQTMDHSLSSYGDPAVDVDVTGFEDAGNSFVGIAIRPFTQRPSICVTADKPEDKGTAKGVVYYRTIAKQSDRANGTDWAEIFERVTETAFARRAGQLGLVGCGLLINNPTMPTISVYDKELGDF